MRLETQVVIASSSSEGGAEQVDIYLVPTGSRCSTLVYDVSCETVIIKRIGDGAFRGSINL